MSNLFVSPGYWSLDPTWTLINLYGRNREGKTVRVEIPYQPWIQMININDNDTVEREYLEGLVIAATITEFQSAPTVGYRLFFTDKTAYMSFIQDYCGPGDLISPLGSQLRKFFIYRSLHPGSYQEIHDITTPEYPGLNKIVDLEYRVSRIRSVNNIIPNMITLKIERSTIPHQVRVEYSNGYQVQNSDINVREISTVINTVRPDHIYLDEDIPRHIAPTGILIAPISMTGNVNNMRNLWMDELENIDKYGVESSIQDLLYVLYGLLPPSNKPVVNHGLYGPLWEYKIRDILNIMNIEDNRFITHIEQLGMASWLFKLGYIEIPNFLWVSDTHLYTSTEIQGLLSTKYDLGLVLGTDRAAVCTTEGLNLKKIGHGFISRTPFPLIDISLRNLMDNRFKGELELSNYLIKVKLEYAPSKVKNQVQELGYKSTGVNYVVGYYQTTEGPILSDKFTLRQQTRPYQIDFKWYEDKLGIWMNTILKNN
jgi:hypothetical protein